MMKRMAVIALALGVGGCATLTTGTDDSVFVDTPDVKGAQCKLTSPGIGTILVSTPGTVNLPRGSDEVQVACEKECYKKAGGVISSEFQGMTFGNILIGGIIGAGVDAASGAMNDYQESISIAMVRDESLCAPS